MSPMTNHASHSPCSPRRARISRKYKRGVTLVEVLIVVAILALIAGGVAVFAVPQWQKAQISSAKTDTKNISAAVDTYKLNHPGSSECPTMEALKNDKTLKQDQNVNDPWGHPYRIICTGDDVTVFSAGPDGKDGGEDDIYSGPKPTK